MANLVNALLFLHPEPLEHLVKIRAV